MEATTRYAKSGDVNIAYQVVGQGPIDLVVVWGWTSHLEVLWDDPDIAELLSRLASFSRLLLFDKRGTGMSDRVPEAELPTLEQRMDDVRAVMDAAGFARAALLGISEGGPMSVMFAATYPDRTTALVLCGSWSTWVKKPDYPWAPTLEQHERAMQMMQARDPAKPFNLEYFAPSKAHDEEFGRRFARYGRLGASPGAALALYRMNIQIDVRPILESIHVPTLVLQRSGDRITYAQAGRYLAEHIAGAKYVELPGTDHLVWVGDREAILGEIEEFLTGIRHAPEADRVLATIVFTDIVDSTARATALGDKAWKDLLARHDSAIRRQIVRFRGREVKTQGDAFVITFDGPARAVRCAQAIIDDVRQLGLAVRIGMHAGEITLLPNDIGGIAVHIAARVSAMAGANETLVSSTVRDLVAGSGISFIDRGVHSLKGLPEAWRIYAVGPA
jgi:pimeloyl-ACP methyl ester carboxylesterase